MDESNQPGVNRRDFLRNAAFVASAAILGLSPQRSALAESTSADPNAAAVTSATSLAFWNGRFVDPRTLRVDGDFYQAGAAITVYGHFVPRGDLPELHFIDGHYAIVQNGQLTSTPYCAWDARTAATHKVTFRMPVEPTSGLTLSVEVNSRTGNPEYYFFSANAYPNSPVLEVGTYALAVGSPNWSAYKIVGGAIVESGNGKPADFEYVLINIAHG